MTETAIRPARLDLSGLSLEEIGARRYAREGVAFSYENCHIAEEEGRVVGMLHGFPMDAPAPGAAEEETDPVLRPYAELEDHGSLYVSGVAVHDGQRGKGLGRRLMAAAEDCARVLGLPRLSLICFEANTGAMRLYARLGYREIDRRPVVTHPTLHYRDGDAVLLVKDVG